MKKAATRAKKAPAPMKPVRPGRHVYRFDEKLGKVVEVTDLTGEAHFRRRPGKKWGMFKPRYMTDGSNNQVLLKPGKKTRERMRKEGLL